MRRVDPSEADAICAGLAKVHHDALRSGMALGAKGMGEGGGAGIHAVCAALQNALGRRGEGPIVWRSCNPYEGVWDLLQKPEDTRKLVSLENR